jgi:TetR/AcrR family transcriptional regulator
MADEQDKRSLKAQQTKNQIIAAAEKLFQNHGFAATSMSEVAREAEVTKSLIHHHFGSKESLWDAVCSKNQVKMKQYLQSIIEGNSQRPDSDFLKQAFEEFFYYIENNPGFSRLQTWVAAEQRSNRSMQLDSLAQLETKIEEIQAQENSAQTSHPVILSIHTGAW